MADSSGVKHLQREIKSVDIMILAGTYIGRKQSASTKEFMNPAG